MILGVSSYTYGWSVGVEGHMPDMPMDEHDLVDKTLKYGLTCLQIGDNLPLHTFSQERLGTLQQRVKQEEIRLEIGARQLTAANLAQYVTIAQSLKSPLVRFVIDDGAYQPDADTILSIIREQLSDLKEKGIKLGIENHDRLKAKELASIIEALGDEAVGVCLDCVNSMGAGEGIEYVANVLAPYTINLHIKDFQIQRLPHKMGFTVYGCPAGKGMTDVPALLKLLLPFGRCESAVLEQWVVPATTLKETVAREEQWATEGVRYLKQFSLFKTKHENIL